jgi:predicted alpha/beta-fold hydrolase
MHFRGCSGRHNRLDRSYHSGDTGDINSFISELITRYPNREIVAVGISLGGNALIKYLGEQGDNCPLTAAMAISIPFDLAICAKELGSGFSRIYQGHLINSLIRKTRDKFSGKPAPIDLNKLNEWTDFYSFDHNVTAPVHGFKSADDYYTKSSCKQFIKHITTPTLILHSKDDPFMNQSAIPSEDDLSESVTLELSEQGGHVGFVYGSTPFNAKYWSEKRMVEFFREKLR